MVWVLDKTAINMYYHNMLITGLVLLWSTQYATVNWYVCLQEQQLGLQDQGVHEHHLTASSCLPGVYIT